MVGPHSIMRCFTVLASASKSGASDQPIVTKEQAMLMMLRTSNSSTRFSTALDNTSNSDRLSDQSIVSSH